MEEGLVSIIVPVYRTPGSILRKCLNSLHEQSYSNLEILVIDDGTPDRNYDDIAEEYRTDSRFTFYRKENGGVSTTRNFGIERCKGEYLAFVDSDDFVETNFIEQLKKAIKNADLSVCGTRETEYLTRPIWRDRKTFFSMPIDFSSVVYMNFSSNKLFCTSIIREYSIRFPETIAMGEDALFLEEYYKHCRSIQSIEGQYYHYIPNEVSVMHTYREEFWDWEHRVIDSQWKMFHTYPLSPRQEKHMLFWLYYKLKDAVNYYLNQEKDPQKLRQKLREIAADPYFDVLKPLLKAKDPWWKKKDRKILRFWLQFGSNGMLFLHRMKKIVKLGR